MGAGPFFAVLGGTRILDASKVDQSGADDGNVIDWDVADDFIIAVNINSGGKDTENAQYKLRWKVSGGGFADLDAAGAMKFGATDLVNGTDILIGARKCDSQGGDTWQNGEEVEGVKDSTAIDLADEFESEVHFSVSPNDAAAGTTYEFELYDSTRGASVGTCGATLTIAAGILEVSVADGIKLGDSKSELMASSPLITDGMKGGDTVAEAMAASPIVTDGVKGGDTTSELGTMETLVSDGVKLGDTTVGAILLLLSLTDGIKIGDAVAENMITDSVLTDGVKIGDIPLIEMSSVVIVTDGIKLGDSTSENIIATVLTTDGIKVGDITVNTMSANPLVTDGALFGDTPLIELSVVIFNLSVTDGINVGDTNLVGMASFVLTSDGLKIGDINIIEMSSETSISEGIELGDIIVGNINYFVVVNDGVKIGDIIIKTGNFARGAKHLGQSEELKMFTRFIEQRRRRG